MEHPYDLVIVGGGINGVGIARDAAGRGLSVLLCEQADLAGATSSASSKLIHGGLRYLEHYEFRLVAEALAEREVMLRIAPHLTRPLRFVMPHAPELRPAWMIRIGLLLYDTLGRLRRHGDLPTLLPTSQTVDLRRSPLGAALQTRFTRGYAYFDARTDDARLTLATARSAQSLGATILPRTRCVDAQRVDGRWRLTLEGRDGRSEAWGRALVNASGPWVTTFRRIAHQLPGNVGVRLVKGSHIVVPKLYDGDHGYLLQNEDRRVIFLIPFEGDFTLIGTTEVKADSAEKPNASGEEIDYLCRAANRFTRRTVTPADVVWQYSGVRPLYDDGHGDPADITRDYIFVLDTDAANQAPLLSVFGGKLTTHRTLAEAALRRLAPWFPQMGPPWTDGCALPGGDFANFGALLAGLCMAHPRLSPQWLEALAHRHGSETAALLDGAQTPDDLGRDFGGGLFEREAIWCIEHEWARMADDILWRRGKFGLHMSEHQRENFAAWFAVRYPFCDGPGD